MADVKWIKFYVSILTSPKIKRIRRMPDGNTIALIWAFLLAQAGESNKDGALYFTDEIPYSPEEFALQYDFETDTVKLAVVTFEKFGMIEIFDGIIYVKNWEEYQNIDGLEKIREQNRIRQMRFKQKQLGNKESNVTDNVTVTEDNATDIDIEEDKDIDIKKKKEPKHKFGEFGHVLLKESESTRLISKLGQDIFDKCIKKLDEYIQETGKKYKDHNLTIRRWVIDAVKEKKSTPAPKINKGIHNFEEREYSQKDYADMEQRALNKR